MVGHAARKSRWPRLMISVQGEPCPDDVKALVKCLPQTQNEVVNRFRVWDHVNTEAVLQHDDEWVAVLRQSLLRADKLFDP